MVGVAGKYKGCNTCRSRRVKCDNTRPRCMKCTNYGRECEGYGRETVFIVSSQEDRGRCASHPPRKVFQNNGSKTKKQKSGSPEAGSQRQTPEIASSTTSDTPTPSQDSLLPNGWSIPEDDFLLYPATPEQLRIYAPPSPPELPAAKGTGHPTWLQPTAVPSSSTWSQSSIPVPSQCQNIESSSSCVEATSSGSHSTQYFHQVNRRQEDFTPLPLWNSFPAFAFTDDEMMAALVQQQQQGPATF